METAFGTKNVCRVVWGDSGDEPLPTRLEKKSKPGRLCTNLVRLIGIGHIPSVSEIHPFYLSKFPPSRGASTYAEAASVDRLGRASIIFHAVDALVLASCEASMGGVGKIVKVSRWLPTPLSWK